MTAVKFVLGRKKKSIYEPKNEEDFLSSATGKYDFGRLSLKVILKYVLTYISDVFKISIKKSNVLLRQTFLYVN